MSFDIKYDRNGNAIPSPAVEAAIAAQQPEPVEIPEPVVESQELHEEKTVPEGQDNDVAAEEVVETAPEQKETAQAKNFRAIKERAERAERERDDYYKRLQQTEKTKLPEPEEDLSFTVDADALVEGKHLSKVDRKIQLLEQKLARYEQRTTETTAETRLKSQHPDFDEVVTVENIQRLQDEYPELAHTLGSTNDLYTKGKSAYMMLKKFGIAKDPVVEAEKVLVQKNAAKPRPLASVSPQQGDTPLSRANAFANGLTKELREQLAREVAEARRNM